ncbi:hypothetical protein V8C44DRAFT_89064 [Trichoderma aethiopicum]
MDFLADGLSGRGSSSRLRFLIGFFPHHLRFLIGCLPSSAAFSHRLCSLSCGFSSLVVRVSSSLKDMLDTRPITTAISNIQLSGITQLRNLQSSQPIEGKGPISVGWTFGICWNGCQDIGIVKGASYGFTDLEAHYNTLFHRSNSALEK